MTPAARAGRVTTGPLDEVSALNERLRELDDEQRAIDLQRAQLVAARLSLMRGRGAVGPPAPAVDEPERPDPWGWESEPSAALFAARAHAVGLGAREPRAGQEEALAATEGGADVVCVLPTGGGKSLVFELLAHEAHARAEREGASARRARRRARDDA